MPDKMGGPAVPTVHARARLHPLAHDQAALSGQGWLGAWQRRSTAATLPHVLDQLEQGEAWSNLARLVGRSEAPLTGMVFTDSDVYKTLEGVAWSAPLLDADTTSADRAQRFVELLEAAQEADGYLNSHVQGSPEGARYADPQWGHELYCAGHLFQAAVAAARTGTLPGLLAVATRLADHLVDRFGEGDAYVEGHPEVETALVELYRVTGEVRYLDLARRQLEQRGHGWLGEDRFGSSYFLDHTPVREGAPATGHAVRQLYLLTGAVDVAVETGDDALLDAAVRTWEDLFASKTYVSGAHGSRHRDEAIGDPHELPADRAYAETCAAIASFQLAWRLLLATGEARYAEVMDTTLHNAIAVSTSADGRAFFYSNPLQLRTGHDGAHEDSPTQRLPWYTCACCPPNLVRLLASVQDYLATTTDAGVQLHHPSTARLTPVLAAGPVTLDVRTEYPDDGRVVVEVDGADAGEWELALRVPAWCTSWTLEVDGVRLDTAAEQAYLRVRRDWSGTHVVTLVLDMPVRLVQPHPRVDAARGCVAVARGPLLHALEAADLPEGVVLEDVALAAVLGVRDPGSGQPPVVDLEVHHRPVDERVRPLGGSVTSGAAVPLRVSAGPYHRWANRTPGAMRVWIPTA